MKTSFFFLDTANNKIITLEDRISDLKAEIGLVYQSVKEFVKERTEGLKLFKKVFGDLVDKVKGKMNTSEKERNRDLER